MAIFGWLCNIVTFPRRHKVIVAPDTRGVRVLGAEGNLECKSFLTTQ
jgi:hypothetical protein